MEAWHAAVSDDGVLVPLLATHSVRHRCRTHFEGRSKEDAGIMALDRSSFGGVRLAFYDLKVKSGLLFDGYPAFQADVDTEKALSGNAAAVPGAVTRRSRKPQKQSGDNNNGGKDFFNSELPKKLGILFVSLRICLFNFEYGTREEDTASRPFCRGGIEQHSDFC